MFLEKGCIKKKKKEKDKKVATSFYTFDQQSMSFKIFHILVTFVIVCLLIVVILSSVQLLSHV